MRMNIQTNRVNTDSDEVIPLKKGSGMIFLPFHISKEILLKPMSRNWS